jgi:DNA-binding transcriptional MocR family regulator
VKQPEKNLAEQVMVRLSGDIRGGRLAPGTRLPTEQMLTTELGVSRTVVREAVAALREGARRCSGERTGRTAAGSAGSRPSQVSGPSHS